MIRPTRLLAKMAQGAPDLLSPLQHRSERVQFDLAVIKARDAAVLGRARLVTAIRGIVKSVGGRLAVCSTGVFSKKALEGCPAKLMESISPLLRIVESLTQEIRGYDKLIARMTATFEQAVEL
jgi:transposase